MKSALIFLNGYYDLRHPEFYKREIEWGLENNYPLICADGGIQCFRGLNQTYGAQFSPNVLIGDLDSFEDIPANSSTTEALERLRESGTHIVREWMGRVDKDYTDGQLAVAHAIEEHGCQQTIIYGGLPRPNGYETDHFLGNLKLMRFGVRVFSQKHAPSKGGQAASLTQVGQAASLSKVEQAGSLLYSAEMRDALQTIHFVLSGLRLERKNEGLQRVSLVAEHSNVTVESSVNLRWGLAGLRIDPDMDAGLPNTLRNEFLAGADWASIRLAKGSHPVYVIHNWYETEDS